MSGVYASPGTSSSLVELARWITGKLCVDPSAHVDALGQESEVGDRQRQSDGYKSVGFAKVVDDSWTIGFRP